jgi:hypothetical protein
VQGVCSEGEEPETPVPSAAAAKHSVSVLVESLGC